MATASPRRTATKKAGPKKKAARTFSLKPLHNRLDSTLRRLRKLPRSEQRDTLIALVKGLRQNTRCGKTMLIVLEA